MPELQLNGKRLAAQRGETILHVARRHGSHIWFLCDGRGICQTCECRVVSGAENLNALTDIERTALRADARHQGYRLGCQARLSGDGSVSAVSRVEDLRERARDVLRDTSGRGLGARVRDLASASFEATLDLVAGVAASSPLAFAQVLRDPPTPRRLRTYAEDFLKILTEL